MVDALELALKKFKSTVCKRYFENYTNSFQSEYYALIVKYTVAVLVAKVYESFF